MAGRRWRSLTGTAKAYFKPGLHFTSRRRSRGLLPVRDRAQSGDEPGADDDPDVEDVQGRHAGRLEGKGTPGKAKPGKGKPAPKPAKTKPTKAKPKPIKKKK